MIRSGYVGMLGARVGARSRAATGLLASRLAPRAESTVGDWATSPPGPPPVRPNKSRVEVKVKERSKTGSLDTPVLQPDGKSVRALDGNTAAAHVAYAMSDASFIYPISPSTSMGETVDKFAAAGRKNIFGQTVQVRQMQSELGSAGALHGALSAGSLCTTFTASQGLLLMIPNMYLVAGELLPAVFHVSARALARQALSIFCDHSDIMAARATGCAMLGGSNQQEVMDLGVISHLAALKSSVPFVHWFDGTRTSSAVGSVQPIGYSTMKALFPWEDLDKFRQRGLNPQHPMMRGLGQDPSVYYQAAVSANVYYDAVPGIVQGCMDQVAAVTGRSYKLFDYYGDPEAERVVVIMGSAALTCEETVDHLRQQGERVGVLKVRLFRPWSVEHFLSVLPETVKAIAVLDRTKEDFASSLPLHADVLTSLSEAGVFKKVVGGNYGLGSKEFAPRHAKAVFDNLLEQVPKKHFTVGINDDVTKTNLPLGPVVDCVPDTTKQCVFWGLGSDGTVGANKAATSIIGEHTNLYAQGHFSYSSQKAGGSTVSHLRFGPTPVRSEYEVEPGRADYAAVHHTSFLYKSDVLKYSAPKSTFVINCPWNTIEQLDNELPARIRREIAELGLDLYTVDAHHVAVSVGLPAKRINQIMQGTFFHLSEVLPEPIAKSLLEDAIDRLYGRKSPQIVASNKAALAAAVQNLHKIDYPASWATAEDNETSLKRQQRNMTEYTPQMDEFSDKFMRAITSRKADELPTSAFRPGGETPIGQTAFEKRGLAEEVPVWIPDNCTQCNLCAIGCPHATIRPFLLDKKEKEAAPAGFETRKAKGSEFGGLNYTIQIGPYDCTGCSVCVEMCPDDALVMKPMSFSAEHHNPHWEYSLHRVAQKGHLTEKTSVKGSQFQEPLLEYSGACAGCGETPYVKLLTQMFGDRMVIANSSGCSSVWGGSFGVSPFKKNSKGQGPAWARSLFEDTAEYGLGMTVSSRQRRAKLVDDVRMILDLPSSEQVVSTELLSLLDKWWKVQDEAEKCNALQFDIRSLVEAEANMPQAPEVLRSLKRGSDMLVPPSHWIIGGDGWAYDIGFGGLDHVLASGENVNVLVLDTEVYSNTGAQASKASPKGASIKMCVGGKEAKKKDLGAIAMMHENAYVASVSMAADPAQTAKAFREAEAFKGPSLIVAYATCVDWGHRLGDKAMPMQQVQAVDSGYWPVYRYDPSKSDEGDQKAFELDAKRISDKTMEQLLMNENRFTSLQRVSPDHAKMLQGAMAQEAAHRHERRRRLAMTDEDLLEHLKKLMGEQTTGERVTVLYGSDTGNAEQVAKNFHFELKRRGMRAKCMSLNEVEVPNLQDESTVLVVCSTAGQGDMPKTAVKFWEHAQGFVETAPPDFLKDTKFAVFGMGDASYAMFNEAAKQIDGLFGRLGAERLMDLGLGDDQHAARFHTVLEDWAPDFFDNIEAPAPPAELGAPTHLVEVLEHPAADLAQIAAEAYVPAHSSPVTMRLKKPKVPDGYERPINHFEFDLTGSGLIYEQGDSLGLWPTNSKEEVDRCLKALGLKGDEVLRIQDVDSTRATPLPEHITPRRLLTEILDIGGWPKRRFYEMLQLCATDPKEREELALICSREGKETYQACIGESFTYAELLEKYPSAVPSIGHLIDYIPDIQPRLYSIASSPRMRGEDELHLCIIRNDWQASSGRQRVGQCTRWLQELDVNGDGIRLPAKVHKAAVVMPETHETPMLMVGLGTGIAPMRAFIEERVAAFRDGEKCGPMALFFGARNRIEYSYEDEFSAYHEEGPLTTISLALSREQKEKIYVTHRLKEHQQLVYDLIHEQKGNLYLCGPGGNVPGQVRKSVVDSIVECGGHSPEYAEKYVMDMQINGRYNVEAW